MDDLDRQIELREAYNDYDIRQECNNAYVNICLQINKRTIQYKNLYDAKLLSLNCKSTISLYNLYKDKVDILKLRILLEESRNMLSNSNYYLSKI